MRVCELALEEVVVGLRIKALDGSNRTGTIVKINTQDDNTAWVRWDGDSEPTSAFYGCECECEIIKGDPKNEDS